MFTELNDEVAGGGFFGLNLRAMARGDEKGRLRLTSEVMAENIERIERIAEGAGDLLGGAALDEESTQRLVLTMLGQPRLEEEAAELT